MKAKERAVRLNKIINGKDSRYTLNYAEVWKDGRIRPVYTIYSDDNNCSPTAYCDEPWFDQDDETVADYLIQLYQSQSLQIDVHSIMTPEYIRSHIRPRLVPSSNICSLQENSIAYRPFLNLAVIYYLPIDFPGEGATVQVTTQLLDNAGFAEDVAYGYAMENLKSEVEFLSMNSMLQSLVGDEDIDFIPTPEDDFGMWILTNRTRTFGSAVLIFGTSLFDALEQRYHSRVALLPSSVHELIAVPYDNEERLTDFLSMVEAVNSSEVSEEDYLADAVYYSDGQDVRVVA